MVKIDKVYTRGGDEGITSLGNGERVSKDTLRIQVCGVLDEANASIGVARLYVDEDTDLMLARIQNDLFDLGADLCVPVPPEGRDKLQIGPAQVERLEEEIDQVNARLGRLNSFILPGGSEAAAFLHVARSIVRRVERLASALTRAEPISGYCLPYLNRLSDHLFVLARSQNEDGKKDILWVPGENR
ncbi:MAG: ATP:cob(I)alamin adenosyltransferase [Rhodospirillaceae bacterium]|nr:ATP:cob(I)alamin adenosyltransferase [Rhodospirillaceae bacterium]|tara:strand:- start:649 stop:1209 length:561 start_codon:yes stop_codon:yes gene_type:complete